MKRVGIITLSLLAAQESQAQQQSTINRYGNGWIVRHTDGSSQTINRYGNGHIVRNPDGSTQTISRYGNGYISGKPIYRPATSRGTHHQPQPTSKPPPSSSRLTITGLRFPTLR